MTCFIEIRAFFFFLLPLQLGAGARSSGFPPAKFFPPRPAPAGRFSAWARRSLHVPWQFGGLVHRSTPASLAQSFSPGCQVPASRRSGLVLFRPGPSRRAFKGAALHRHDRPSFPLRHSSSLCPLPPRDGFSELAQNQSSVQCASGEPAALLLFPVHCIPTLRLTYPPPSGVAIHRPRGPSPRKRPMRRSRPYAGQGDPPGRTRTEPVLPDRQPLPP